MRDNVSVDPRAGFIHQKSAVVQVSVNHQQKQRVDTVVDDKQPEGQGRHRTITDHKRKQTVKNAGREQSSMGNKDVLARMVWQYFKVLVAVKGHSSKKS